MSRLRLTATGQEEDAATSAQSHAAPQEKGLVEGQLLFGLEYAGFSQGIGLLIDLRFFILLGIVSLTKAVLLNQCVLKLDLGIELFKREVV